MLLVDLENLAHFPAIYIFMRTNTLQKMALVRIERVLIDIVDQVLNVLSHLLFVGISHGYVFALGFCRRTIGFQPQRIISARSPIVVSRGQQGVRISSSNSVSTP